MPDYHGLAVAVTVVFRHPDDAVEGRADSVPFRQPDVNAVVPEAFALPEIRRYAVLERMDVKTLLR